MNHQDLLQQWTGVLEDVSTGVTLDSCSPPLSFNPPPVEARTMNTHRAWNVAAAVGHAMWRRSGTVANKTFDIYTDYDDCQVAETDCDPCGNGGGACSVGGDMHMSTQGVNGRFVIVHEMGHALGYFLGDNASASNNTSADDGCCWNGPCAGKHQMQSKEWQATAIREGWAHFYAATAFNKSNETDCGFVYYKSQDYNLDNSSVEAPDPHALSCEQGPDNLYTAGTIGAKDYLDEMCSAGTLTDRGTEMDWLRFWWDFMSEESTVTFNNCALIYKFATTGAHHSPPTGGWVPTPGSSTSNANRPGIRMKDAAGFWGYSTEWSNHNVSNGVHR